VQAWHHPEREKRRDEEQEKVWMHRLQQVWQYQEEDEERPWQRVYQQQEEEQPHQQVVDSLSC